MLKDTHKLRQTPKEPLNLHPRDHRIHVREPLSEIPLQSLDLRVHIDYASFVSGIFTFHLILLHTHDD